MRENRRIIKGIITGVLCFLILMIILSEYGFKEQESLYPDIVIAKFKELKDNSVYSDSIGYVFSYNYTFNYTNQLHKDTIEVFVNLNGAKRKLNYEGQFSKSVLGWDGINETIVIR